MSVIQVPFAELFDRSVNYAPAAIIGMRLDDLVARRHLTIEAGEDGLDAFQAVPLVLEADTMPRLKFALWRHKGNPANTFSINFGLSDIGVAGLVAAVLTQLDIPDGAVIWRAAERFSDPTAELMKPTRVVESVHETAGVVEEVVVRKGVADRAQKVIESVRHEAVEIRGSNRRTTGSKRLPRKV